MDGTHPSIKPRPVRMSKLAHMVKSMDMNKPLTRNFASINLVKKKPEEESDSLEAEEMDIQFPWRCHRCSN